MRGQFPQTVTSISVDHLWGVKAKFLVRVDGNQDGRDPGVDLVTLEPVIEVLDDALLRSGIVVNKVRAAQLLV